MAAVTAGGLAFFLIGLVACAGDDGSRATSGPAAEVAGVRATPQPTATPVDPALLLPDLRVLPPSDLRIAPEPQTGGRLLWFSTTIWNGGLGPLELRGSFNPETGLHAAQQHVYHREGRDVDRTVGEFLWHAPHDHWHFDRPLAVYTLWPVSTGDAAGGDAGSEKTTWCLTDHHSVAGAAPAPQAAYTVCQPLLQGISVAWADVYDNVTEGQSINITDLPDGDYVLRSTINPDRFVAEVDYTNNTAHTYVTLRGTQVTSQPPDSPE